MTLMYLVNFFFLKSHSNKVVKLFRILFLYLTVICKYIEKMYQKNVLYIEKMFYIIYKTMISIKKIQLKIQNLLSSLLETTDQSEVRTTL